MSPRLSLLRRSDLQSEPTTPEPTESAGAPKPAAANTSPAEADAGDIHDAMVRLRDEGHAVLGWVADDAYPMNVDVNVEVKLDEGVIRFSQPLGFKIPPGSTIAVTSSQAGGLAGGLSGRRHLTLWGVAAPRPRGRFILRPDRVWAWDGGQDRLAADYERRLPGSRRYFESLSAERGFPVRPGLSADWLIHRATRAPFLSATLVPVLLGMAVAARANPFHWVAGALTVAAAVAFLIGLSIANGVFDPFAAADRPSVLPPEPRVAVLGRSSVRAVLDRSMPAAGFFAAAAVAWVAAGIIRSSPELAAVSAVGIVVAVLYSLPQFRMVGRGLGEVAVGLGFGPILLFGAYAIQFRGPVSAEALLAALSVGLLATLIVYIHEIKTRTADAVTHRQTLPVLLSRVAVIRGYDVAVSAAYILVAVGVVAGVLPLPVLLVVASIPLAVSVRRGLAEFYEDPSRLIEPRDQIVRLHATFGTLLLVGYALTLVDQAVLGLRPYLW